jgi:predicted ATPase/DNA-binding SARP family transcriptional activator
LRIELLGGFRVVIEGHVPSRLPSTRQQQLIAFLVLHARNTAIARQRVAGSLWPESSDTQALTNLRRELHHLKDAWPTLEALIVTGSRTLAWSDNGAGVDVVSFEDDAERGLAGDRGALHRAARLYTGELVPGWAAEWIDADRERLRRRARQVLARLVDLLEQDRAFGDAIGYAQQSLHLDPLHEESWCALMRCHARHGGRATALHLYQECAALLKKELGIQPSAATRATYREILDLDAETPFILPAPRTLVYPLVGRNAEWQALLNAWHTASAGRPRLFLIRGEAGIGKSRLAEELIGWCGRQRITVVTARCYSGEGRLPYAPIAAWLKSAALQSTLARLDAASLSDVARLRPEIVATRSDVPAPDRELESWQRLRFFEALAQTLRSAAPLVLVLDDLQWADADTIEWLQYFLHSAGDTPFLLVGSLRGEEEQDNPPLGRLLGHLERDHLLTAILLGPLDRTATGQLAAEVAEHPLDEAVLARTFQATEGHPLFIIERGRMELRRQAGGAGDDGLPRVQAVVAARLELLSEEARAVAEVASAIGRDFRFDILEQASDLEEDALVRALDELWRRHIVRVQADERWDFSHDRIREVTYDAIGPARRRLLHRRIAQGMELLFADRLDEVSASIAMHLDRGGRPARAVPFLERAAAAAMRVSAGEEAIRCLTHALSLHDRAPAGRERDERELALRSSLAVALNSARGYAAPEVEQNLDRVFMLARSFGDVPVRWMWAAFTFRIVRADLHGARDLAEQALARSQSDPSCRCEAHHAMAAALVSMGELDMSRYHFEASLAAYDDQHPQGSALGLDLGVFARAFYSHTLWLLGHDDAAVSHVEQAVAHARRLDHVYSMALALAYEALLHQMRGDAGKVLDRAEEVVALCDRYGLAYYGDWAHVLIGWARGLEQPAEGAQRIEAALLRFDATRSQQRRPYYLSLLAETHARLGNRERAASIVDTAITVARQNADVWWLPALYFQKSELDPPPQRPATLRCALEVARSQNSRSLERRILASPLAPSI